MSPFDSRHSLRAGTPLWRRYLRFWGADPAADVDDEFAFHLESRIDELRAQGLSLSAARDEALRGFGNIQDVKRICRTLAEEREHAMRRTQWWSDWRHDFRFAVRQLTVSPFLTAVLVLTIALGIGSTVAIFSVVNAVLLRPLPGDDSERIVWIYETLRSRTGSASAGHFHDWTEQGTVFEHTAAGSRGSFNLSDGEPERVFGMQVTPGYFRVIHVQAVLGRYFTEADTARDSRLVVLSHGLWQRRFAGDPSIVGRSIRIYGEAHTVVGVAPPEYVTTRFAPQLWMPLVLSPQQRANYGNHSFTVVAKLKPGVTLSAAQADMERVTRGIAERQPRITQGRGVNVRTYRDVVLGGDFRAGLYVLLASVTLVLLIGCVNVANLLLARATTRRREIAIRAAIGGGRWRIVRQLLTESVVLAIVGGVAGVAVAWVGIRLFVRFGPPNVPRLQDAGFQTEVLIFAVGISLLTGLVFGLAPALRAAREDLLTTLRQGGKTSLPAARDRLRGVLVVGEIALAVVLLVGAGLFLRSAWRLQQVPLGFDANGVLTARLALPAQRYESNEAVAAAYRRLLEELRAAPEIRHVGASTNIPLMGGGIDSGIEIEGKKLTPGTRPSPSIRLVTDDYVEAIGMTLKRGRTLKAADMAPDAPPAVMINEQLANVAWPGEDPIGKRLSTWTRDPNTPEWREVIGVIGDVKTFGPDTPARPELFLPYTQPPSAAWPMFQRSLALVARTTTAPAALVSTLRRVVRSVDSSVPLSDVQTMEEVLGADGAGPRFNTWLLSLLASAALLLATVGIYGVIAYFVTQRTSEIGLRMALGATPGSVLVMVVRRGALLALAGIAIGLVAALAATRMVTALLFEITPTDLPTYVAGGVGLMIVALLACAVPAVRAVRISPMRSLAES
jgi:putative ABC transport system permease protein